MGCYAVPLAAAIIHYGLRRNVDDWKTSTHHQWLTLLFAGSSLFGVIDHLWNGELFMVSENLFWDLMLGVAITIAIVVFWGIMVVLDKRPVSTKTIS